MPHQAQSESPTRREDNFARKARILLDLFGPSGVERLRQAGLPTGADDVKQSALDDFATDKDRDALLERFRKHGLFETETLRSRTEANPAPQATPPLTARIADHLDEAALDREHPAVIAMVLRSQTKALQSRALHALPGPVARATVRYLRG